MLDYNTAKLGEAGFDAPGTTWAEIDEQARAVKEQGVEDYPVSFGAIDWSWYLVSLSMGDPMFDADLNPVFADEGSKAREAMALLLSWFADEIISPALLSGTTQHDNLRGGTGTYHQGWQGSASVGNNAERLDAGTERRIRAAARGPLHVVAAGRARHRHGQPQP